MPMRDYENIKDITIPPEQEAIMNIVCDTWEECHELECTNCPDRPKKIMSIMECFALKLTRKLIEAGYAPVVRCKDCALRKTEDCMMYYECDCGEQHTWESDNDYCSHGERKEE